MELESSHTVRLRGGCWVGCCSARPVVAGHPKTFGSRLSSIRQNCSPMNYYVRRLASSPQCGTRFECCIGSGFPLMVIGPRTIEQLDTSLRALEITLSTETLKRLDAIFPGTRRPGPGSLRLVSPGKKESVLADSLARGAIRAKEFVPRTSPVTAGPGCGGEMRFQGGRVRVKINKRHRSYPVALNNHQALPSRASLGWERVCPAGKSLLLAGLGGVGEIGIPAWDAGR